MKKIAVTGSLSSGKSTVCQILKELGAYLVSADEIVHNLLASDLKIREKIIVNLGEDVLVQNQLNREAIAKKVFCQPSQLQFLENLLHPEVQKQFELEYKAIKQDPKYNFFVAEVPLLYEANMEHFFDFVIVVTADETACKKRFYAKKQHDDEQFSQRWNRQIPVLKKICRADFVIINNTSLADLKNEVTKITHQLHSKRRLSHP